MIHKLLYIGCVSFFLFIEFAGISGCVKEYSYEGGPAIDSLTDTVPVTDTVKNPILKFPYCAECASMNDFIYSKWSFKYDTSVLCGNITKAVIAPERTAFTFFGPSACSVDTGLVMTVYLINNKLDRDQTFVVTDRIIFEYYDNTTMGDVFTVSQPRFFSLIIDSYEHATGTIRGRFNGTAFTKDNKAAIIVDGKFDTKFE